jgi:hypothetical protein
MARNAQVIDSLADRILDLERFIEIDESTTYDVVEQQKNANTKKMTESHTRLFNSFLISKNENRKIEEIPPKDLDLFLAQFFLGVRKPSSSDDIERNDVSRQYEPSTLQAMQGSIHRYLGDKKYAYNIKNDDHFKHSRDVLCAKAK